MNVKAAERTGHSRNGPRQHPHLGRFRKVAMLMLSAACVLVAVGGVPSFSRPSGDALDERRSVATVNGERITVAEFGHWMRAGRAEVYQHFYREHGAVDNGRFWQSRFEGESPGEILKRRALAQAVRHKVQQQLAARKGVIDTSDYHRIMAEREAVNRRRAARAERGGTVHGPVTFTPQRYFERVTDRMVRKLKAALADGRFRLSESELRRRYERDYLSTLAEGRVARPFSQMRRYLQAQHVERAYQQLIEREAANAEVRVDRTVWHEMPIP